MADSESEEEVGYDSRSARRRVSFVEPVRIIAGDKSIPGTSECISPTELILVLQEKTNVRLNRGLSIRVEFNIPTLDQTINIRAVITNAGHSQPNRISIHFSQALPRLAHMVLLEIGRRQLTGT